MSSIHRKIAVLAFCANLFAVGASAQLPRAEATTDSFTILVGDPLGVTIVLHGPMGEELIPPAFPTDTNGVEVLRAEPPQVSEQNGERTLKMRIFVTAWDSGKFVYPPMAFQSGKSGMAYVPSFNFSALYPKESLGDTARVAPIRPIIGEPRNWEDYQYWLYFLGGLLAVGLLAYLLVKYRKRPAKPELPPPPPPTPYEVAMQKLSALQLAELWQKGQVKEYYSELTYILREYIENQFTVPALESTTDELMLLMKKGDWDIETVSKDELRRFLQEADLVKFAKFSPAEAAHESAFEFVKRAIGHA